MLMHKEAIHRALGVVMTVTLLLGPPTAVRSAPPTDAEFAALTTRVREVQVMARNKDNNPGPVAGGHYDDTFVRENGVWKFQRRIVMMEIPFQDPREIRGEPPVGPPPAA